MTKLTGLRAAAFLLAVASLNGQTAPLIPESYTRYFNHTNPVLKRIQPGEVVVTKTIDSGGRDYTGTVKNTDGGNPLTGPFYIEGAEPGDAIQVTFRRMRLNRNWGTMAYRLGLYSVLPEAIPGLHSGNDRPDAVFKGRGNLVKWDIDTGKNMVKLNDPMSKVAKLEYPAIPMLGCIGVAAQGDQSPNSGPSGAYGGNIDYNQVKEGATVILPVYHPGAYLYIGDGHALMGDGEATGNGIETSMDVEFSVTVRKKANLTGPRLENSESIISIGSQPEFVSGLDRALQMATTDMVRWLQEDYRMEPWAAHLLVSLQARYDVITVAGSMGLRIPKKYLPPR